MPGRILIVDDVGTNRLVLRTILTKAYYEVVEVACGEQALAAVAEQAPDLVLLDVMMPGMDGYEVCGRLKADPALAHVPIAMITSLHETEERLRGLAAGADDFISKPVQDVELLARVASLIRMKMMVDEIRLREETTRALGMQTPVPFVLDDDHSDFTVMLLGGQTMDAEARARAMERGLSCATQTPATMADAQAMIAATPPDAVLLDRSLANGDDGLRLIGALKAAPDTRQAPILLVVPEGDQASASLGLDLGANDFLMAPFELAEMVARMRSQLRRKRYSDRLRDRVHDGLMMAVTDSLTGAFNRRYAKSHLSAMVAQSAAGGLPLAAMMLDLDKFKLVNDTHGHGAGDAVLKEFARRLQANVRGVDLVARLGGEEFFVAMPDATEYDARSVSERIRAAVEEDLFQIDDNGGAIPVTVSIGVTMIQPGDDSAALMDRADEALYQSKETGRNKVTFSLAA